MKKRAALIWIAGVLLAVTLGGCVVVPPGPGGYYPGYAYGGYHHGYYR